MDKKFHPNSDFISNDHSVWSTRTFNFGLKFDSRCDIVGLLDQLAFKTHPNPHGRFEKGHDSQFDEHELECMHHGNTGYLKCDLACPGLRLVRKGDTHAEFLVYMKFGDVIVSSWKRFNDFKILINKIDPRDFPTVRNNPAFYVQQYIYATLPYNVIQCHV